MLRCLLKVKEALSAMVISNQWSIWKQSNSERTNKVRDLILNLNWWDNVEYVLNFIEPIMSMLRYTNIDATCLGEVYDGMDTMVEKIKVIIAQREKDPQEFFFKRVEQIIHHRWNKMTTPLHLLAHALNPMYYSSEVLSLPGRTKPYRDPEVAAGYKRSFARLYSDPEVVDGVRKEFGLFISGRSHSPCAINDQSKIDGVTWWYLHGQDFMFLQPLAIKILSQGRGNEALGCKP
ncbi:uncharacterized protein LOC131033010 [Cryptomeria japonica]|uniref:uncharacterized protein LOC131033010 n=1 Tax=Cryptomeria japonica TaxID=3369 RepID=UPI0027DAA2A0|nr:uncharacterized protein LOC131033010 [Cryptomeria japonica]